MNRLRRIFWQLARVNTPSFSENRIAPKIVNILHNSGFKVAMDKYWNIIATNGEPGKKDLLPMLCAHADTVNTSSSTRVKLVYNNIRKIIHTSNFDDVLGGDDKCGIAIILRLAEMAKKDNLKFVVVITRGEESGVGASELNPAVFDMCEYSIVIDRRGSGDIVHNIYGKQLCDNEFALWVEDMAPPSITTRKITSMHSDADPISDHIDSVNISCGYYEPHSDGEYVDLREMYAAMVWVKNIITNKYVPEKYKGKPFYSIDPYLQKAQPPSVYGYGGYGYGESL